MLDKLKTSSKTIVHIVDLINSISILRTPDNNIIDKIIINCNINSDNDKYLFLYNMQSIIVKAYSNNMINKPKEDIINYFNNILDIYNDKLSMNFSRIHSIIWYVTCLRSLDGNDIGDIKNIIENEIINNNEFDNCETMHKLDILTYYLSILLNEQNIDIDKINNINNKIKYLNSLVKGE